MIATVDDRDQPQMARWGAAMIQNAAIYTSSRGVVGGEDPELRQLRACRAYAEAKGWNLAGTYSDTGPPTGRRRGFEALLQAAGPGKIEAIIITGIDRLPRPATDEGGALDQLDRAGVEVAIAPFDYLHD